MNRYAKGAIAAGAATVLLLGGLGTFALWSDNRTIGAGNVTSGQLELDASGMEGAWYRYIDGADDPEDYAEETPLAPATYKVVPGDELIFVATGVSLTAEGGELYFTVSTTLVEDADAGGFTVDGLAVSGGDIFAAEGADVDEFVGVDEDEPVYRVTTAGEKVDTFDVTVKISFDASGVANQNANLDLSSAAILVEQVVKS